MYVLYLYLCFINKIYADQYIHIVLRNTGTQTHGLIHDKSGQPLPSLADLSLTQTEKHSNNNNIQQQQQQHSYDDDWDDIEDEKEPTLKKKGKKKKKKKKKEKKRRSGNASIPSMSSEPTFFDDIIPPNIPKFEHQGIYV